MQAETSELVDAEVGRLRVYINDWISLLALPAVWTDLEPHQIFTRYESRLRKSGVLASPALRIHDHLPLPISAAHHGTGLVPGLLEMARPKNWRREVQ